MDQFENQLRQFYQEKKDEDNKLIPGFETFHTSPLGSSRRIDKQSKPLKKTVLIFRIAASIAAIAAVTVFFISRSGENSKPADKITSIDAMNFPTHSLNDQSLSPTYIWEWTAPTDKLLEDVKKQIGNGQ